MGSSTSSKSPLRRLADIISDAVDKIDSKCSTAGQPFPLLDEPFNPTNPSEALALDPEILQNAMVIIAAANQLSSTVRLPALSVFDLALGFHISSSLQALLRGGVAEVIREGGAKGVHAKDIAAKNNMDADKVSRLLRLLATHHVFREVEPDVWAHNRLSSLLDTMKPSKEIFANPDNKHVGTPGFAALIEHVTDDGIISSSSLGEVLTNPKTSRSDDPTQSAWNHSHNIKTLWFEWIEAPEREKVRSRFNIAMDGVSKMDDGRAMLKGFPWETLSDNSTVVDVGGGLGSASLTVAKEFPRLKFVIQDRPALQQQCEKFLEDNLPGAQQAKRVTFQGHDFFTPQPVKDATLFMLRMITHDWPTTLVIKILKQLRAVAQPGKTKLLLVDQVAPYAGPDAIYANKVPGAESPPVPEPLLSNLGKANSIIYLGDLQMLTFHQGQERTLGNHLHATKEAGWKITHVYSPPGSIFRHIVGETI